MKIAVVSSTVFQLPIHGYGGLEAIAWLIAKGLAEKGHKVSLVAPDGSTCPGVEVIQVGPAGMVGEAQAYGGFAEIKDQGGAIVRQKHDGYWQHLLEADVIIDHSWQKYAYLLKAEGRLKAPVLGVCHAPINTMYGSLPPGVDKPSFIAISKDQAAHIEALHEHPAKVAYNGIDLDMYQPIPGIKRTDRFLFLARFSTIKGPHIAIEACKRAGVGLDLVGDASITGEPQLYEQCKRMADGKQIRIIGACTRGETVHWYSQAHCMLHPNKHFREPFGLAPIEAMACGCPVIAWDRGAMRETIKDGGTGFLVSSMEQLVEKIKFMASGMTLEAGSPVRVACREWASQFSIQAMVDRYEILCIYAKETGGW